MALPLLAASIALPIAGSLLGELLASGDKKRQKALEDEALRLYGDASPPTLERVLAEKLSTGEWDSMPSDFGARSYQDEAIRRMREVVDTGGMDALSRQATEQARLAGAAQEQRGRASVRQEAERRGMGGNAEYLGQLAAQQAGSQTASMGAMEAASQGQLRALQAMRDMGALGTQVEGQRFGQASTKAAARDAINRWNAENALRVGQYNNALAQQEWSNSMGLKDRQYGATTRRADSYGRSADRTRQMWGGLGQSAGYGLNAYGQLGGMGGGGGVAPAPAFNPMAENYGAVGSDAALEYWRRQGGR